MARRSAFETIQRVLGRRIHHVRIAKGLSQEAAAARAQIDYKRWQRIEAGEVNCTVRTLVRVADALEVSFWSLMSGPESDN